MQPEGVAQGWPPRRLSCERICSRWQDAGPLESIGIASDRAGRHLSLGLTQFASADAHTSTHAGGIASRRNRSRTAGSTTGLPASSTHLSGRTVIRWSPGGRKARGVGSVRLWGPLSAPERSGRLPPTPDSQASEGENEPTPTRVRNILAAGISTIVNVMSLNDQSLEATSIAAPANLIEHDHPAHGAGSVLRSKSVSPATANTALGSAEDEIPTRDSHLGKVMRSISSGPPDVPKCCPVLADSRRSTSFARVGERSTHGLPDRGQVRTCRS